MTSTEILEATSQMAQGNLSKAQEIYLTAVLYRYELVDTLPYIDCQIKVRYYLGMGAVTYGPPGIGAIVDGGRCAELGW